MQSLLALEESGELKDYRVLAYATREHVPAVREVLGGRDASAPVQFGGLKLFLDGTLNSRTASVLEPFADPLPDYPRGMTNGSAARQSTRTDSKGSIRFSSLNKGPIAFHAAAFTHQTS